jgi:hypothetical protein
MPKKVKKGDIERWKKLRHEGLTYGEIAKETSWSRQKIASELKKFEPKPPEAPQMPESNFQRFINVAGSIVQRKCTKRAEGYCKEMEFLSSDWAIEDFKKIFGDFVLVERKGKSYLRPKVPFWLCFICGQRKEIDAKIAELDGKIVNKDARMKNSLRMARKEIVDVQRELLEKINKTGADLRKQLFEELNNVKVEIGELKQNLNGPVEAAKIMRMYGLTIREVCFSQYGTCRIPPSVWSRLGYKLPSPYFCAFCLARPNRR